jgi:hypothetical protein
MKYETTYISKNTLPVTTSEEVLALQVEVFNDDGKVIGMVVKAEDDGEFWKVTIQKDVAQA